MHRILPILLIILGTSGTAMAQSAMSGQGRENLPDPKIAFLKSLAVPGWGHHYVNQDQWQRGQYHLAADAALLLSYIGLRWHSNNLQQNWYTYARHTGGVDIENRDRLFQLAVGQFNDLEAYNAYQERVRNWNALYEDTPQNRWGWQDDLAREDYQDLRDRFETIDQQLPALLSLMVVNRVVSAISAYNRARRLREAAPSMSVRFSPSSVTGRGIVANLRIGF